MSFEDKMKDMVINCFRQECRKILDKHIDNALLEMKEQSNQVLAEIGLKLTKSVSYYDNSNNIRVELVMPTSIKSDSTTKSNK